jgi:hypothetical protein
MTPADFTRLALSLDGAEQGSHMGAIDFRVGGRIFATLAHQAMGCGNLMLTPEQQAAWSVARRAGRVLMFLAVYKAKAGPTTRLRRSG